jgi:hypothetical protein
LRQKYQVPAAHVKALDKQTNNTLLLLSKSIHIMRFLSILKEATRMKAKSKWTKPLLLALLCLVLFCLVATIFQIISVEDLPINFIAAFLEAVVTALITVVLLSGQSAAEEVKERNVKVFEKKSAIFQNYINTVWKIWEDSTVSKEEYFELTSIYYKTLMIYLKKEALTVIGDSLIKIGDYIDKKSDGDYLILRNCIFTIINTLSKELSLGGEIDVEIYEKLETKMKLCKE